MGIIHYTRHKVTGLRYTKHVGRVFYHFWLRWKLLTKFAYDLEKANLNSTLTVTNLFCQIICDLHNTQTRTHTYIPMCNIYFINWVNNSLCFHIYAVVGRSGIRYNLLLIVEIPYYYEVYNEQYPCFITRWIIVSLRLGSCNVKMEKKRKRNDWNWNSTFAVFLTLCVFTTKWVFVWKL